MSEETKEPVEKVSVTDKMMAAGDKLEVLIRELGTKPSWGAKEIVEKIKSVRSNIGHSLKDVMEFIPTPKKMKVDHLKKYDVIYVNMMGIPHYFLVHKIQDEKVYGVVFSSKERYSVAQIQKDRFFKHSYATSSYLYVELEDALESFSRVYENKQEADMIFTKVRDFYANALGTRPQSKKK